MSDEYIQLSCGVAQRLRHRPLPQLNTERCGLLQEKLLEVVERVRDDVNSLPPETKAFISNQRKHALQQLYRVVTMAAAIIHVYYRFEDWLKKGIKQHDSTEAFVDSFFNLYWCDVVIARVVSDARTYTTRSDLRRSVAENRITFSPAQCKRKKEEIRSSFKTAAMADHENLRMLYDEREGHGEVADEQELKLVAKFLELKPDCVDHDKKVVFLPSIDPADVHLKRKIGSGSSGDVYTAECLGQEVAVKIFEGMGSESSKKEAEITAGPWNPHLVRVFGSSEDKGGRFSLIMELMSADLNSFLEQTTANSEEPPFKLPVALDIMQQVAEGIECIHDRGIAHCDLKSANLLVSRVEDVKMADEGYLRVKLCDFGQARIVGASSYYEHKFCVGTTLWMAPELYVVPTTLNHPLQVDQFSCAIIFSEIATGNEPYYSHDWVCRSILREKIKSEDLRPQLPTSLPRYLASLIKECWDKHPRRRPSFAEICAHLRHLKAVLMIGEHFRAISFQPWGT